ncbi:MAG: XRE family transcriptional regulator [Gammaproteobacteria bacterium]|nr:XRE family transcriptional regulator [Gammaproteobacteria bacterium]
MKAKEHESVWDALEDDPVIAANMKLRSRLMIEISQYVKQSGLTQKEAASQLGTTQPRLNDVLKGKIDKCTVDRLVNMLSSAGFDVDLNVSRAA